MKEYDTILFDLDGTLTDSGKGIINAAEYALAHYGIQVEDRMELRKFVGPPLGDSFKEFYGFSEEKTEEAIRFFREYYNVKGVYENELYEGITEMLKTLKASGKKLIVATSKLEKLAFTVLDYFEIRKYFDDVVGSNLEGTRVVKEDVLSYIFEKNQITDRSKVLMVGDRKFDVEGAKKMGVDSMGVLYGYGSKEELMTAGADYIARTAEEISQTILGTDQFTLFTNENKMLPF